MKIDEISSVFVAGREGFIGSCIVRMFNDMGIVWEKASWIMCAII